MFPEDDVIARTLKGVGADKIMLSSPQRGVSHEARMRISFAAVGKGYAADKVKSMLMRSVHSGA